MMTRIARRCSFSFACAAIVWMTSATAMAALDVRSDGSDGTFAPTLIDGEGDSEEKVITVDLSEAVSGTWNQPISEAERRGGDPVYGRGVYDADRWAIVFKYERVHIPKGLRVRFKNHPSRAPVVWLVKDDVTIEGIVDVSGENAATPPIAAEPGPGGFRGGVGRYLTYGASSGYGPGGGEATGQGGAGGSYATKGSGNSGNTYGISTLLPLLGGSGGSSAPGSEPGGSAGGGAGGGAILIAAGETIQIDGTVVANGGAGNDSFYHTDRAGCGSGGGVRLIANTLAGSGNIEAVGATIGHAPAGGWGRIRLERVSVKEGATPLQIVPSPSVATAEETPQLWPEGDDGSQATAKVRVISVGGQQVPADPRASFGATGADVVLPELEQTEVVIEVTNAASDSVALVRMGPRSGQAEWITAERDESRSSPDALVFKATVPVHPGFSTIQALVRQPVENK